MPGRPGPDAVAVALCGVPRVGGCEAAVAAGLRGATADDDRGAVDSAEAAARALRTRLEGVLGTPPFPDADVALSGGLDSATLAGLARKRGPAPTAWTLDDGFAEEVGRAADVARDLRLRHERVRVSAEELPAAFHDAVVACDSVLWNARAVAKHLFWTRVAARGARRVMVGAGADEVLGDPAPWLDGFVEIRRAQRELAQSLLHPQWRAGVPAVEAWLGLPEREPSPPDFDPRPGLLRSIAVHETLPPEVRAGAAAGIDVLLPYLHPDVASFALGRPSCWRRRAGHDKWLLREATEGLLSEAARWQRKTPRVSPAGGGSERARSGWLELFGAFTTPQRVEPLCCVAPATARRLFEEHAASGPGEEGYAVREAVLMRLASLVVLSETAAR